MFPLVSWQLLFVYGSHFVWSHYAVAALFIWHLIPTRCGDWWAQNAPGQLWAQKEKCYAMLMIVCSVEWDDSTRWTVERQHVLTEEDPLKGQIPLSVLQTIFHLVAHFWISNLFIVSQQAEGWLTGLLSLVGISTPMVQREETNSPERESHPDWLNRCALYTHAHLCGKALRARAATNPRVPGSPSPLRKLFG